MYALIEQTECLFSALWRAHAGLAWAMLGISTGILAGAGIRNLVKGRR